MEPRLIRAAYDREAPTYEARFREQQQPKIDALLALLAPPAHLPVLDAGAGTGLFAAAAHAHPAWRPASIVSLDLSHAMLARAPASEPRVQGEAARLPFRRGAFGLVVCVTGLVAPEQLRPALTSMCRVVAPGGRVALCLRPRDLPNPSDLLDFPLVLEHVGTAGIDDVRVWRRR